MALVNASFSTKCSLRCFFEARLSCGIWKLVSSAPTKVAGLSDTVLIKGRSIVQPNLKCSEVPTSVLVLEKQRVWGLLGRDHLESSTQDQPLQGIVSKGLGLLALEKV